MLNVALSYRIDVICIRVSNGFTGYSYNLIILVLRHY